MTVATTKKEEYFKLNLLSKNKYKYWQNNLKRFMFLMIYKSQEETIVNKNRQKQKQKKEKDKKFRFNEDKQEII